MRTTTVLAAVLAVSFTACEEAKISEENVVAPELKQDVSVPSQSTCQDREFRQLDFWVGEWDLEWDLPEEKTGQGTNIITKTPYGDCVITENFDGAPTQQFKGMSVSTYHKPVGMWRQTWVDDQGGYYALSGGLQADGTFKLDMTRMADNSPFRRMVWRDIKKDSFTWFWQGHGVGETVWKDLWVIRYARKPEP